MSEIEKMYENVELLYCNKCRHDSELDCIYMCESKYPSFTVEKQIEIIKLITKQGQVIIENWEKDNRGFNVTFRANSNLRYITMVCITRKTIEEALAQIVNDIWQDLTDTKKSRNKRDFGMKTIMIECPDCEGTGLYVGMCGEKDGAAVVCTTCGLRNICAVAHNL